MKVLSEFGRSSRDMRRTRLADILRPGHFSRPAKCPVFAQRLHLPYPHLALAGLAFLLGAILILECHAISIADHGIIADISPPRDTKTRVQTIRAGFPEHRAVDHWSSVALARPLFNADRTPPEAMAQAVAPPPLPRLAGIIITSNKQLAIFCGPNGSPVIVKAGDRLWPYEIVSIGADGVRLDSLSGIQTLHIVYGGSAAPENAIAAPLKTAALPEITGSNAWPIQFNLAGP